MRCIMFPIDDQLLYHLFLFQVFARHLCLDDNALLLQQKIRTRFPARIARCPFLRPYVVEENLQQGMQKILNVVFVHDFQRAALVMPLEQLMSDERKTPEEVLNQSGGVPMGTAKL